MTGSSMRYLRLQHQHLMGSKLDDPAEVVRSLVAVQAQDYYGAKWALAQRTTGSKDAEVEKAINDGRILRLHVMRPTWHFVGPEDIRWLVKLTAPRVNAASRSYYRKAELDDALFKRTNRILTKALLGGKHLTRAELRVAMKRAGIEPGDSTRLGYIMHRAELDGVVCNGARRGNQFTYALLDERVPKSRVLDMDEALGELVTRYFTTRGPATVQDFVWWSGLTITQAKSGIQIAGPALKSEVIENATYMSSSNTRRETGLIRQAHLLPAYDEYFIAYKDRSVGIHPNFHKKGIAEKVLFDSPLMLDGQVVGGWKRLFGKNVVTITLRPFVSVSKRDRALIVLAAEKYAEFLELETRIQWATEV